MRGGGLTGIESGTILDSDVGCSGDDAELNESSKDFESEGTHE